MEYTQNGLHLSKQFHIHKTRIENYFPNTRKVNEKMSNEHLVYCSLVLQLYVVLRDFEIKEI